MDDKRTIYVIECAQHNHYYVGLTRNLPRRLEQHRTGKGSSLFVKEHGGLGRLVYSETAESKKEARQKESALTKDLIMKHGPEHVAGAGLIWLEDRIKYRNTVQNLPYSSQKLPSC